MYITLDEAKRQLGYELTDNFDNTRIQLLIEVAENIVEAYMFQTLQQDIEMNSNSGLTPMIKNSILMTISTLDEQKGNTIYTTTSKSYFDLERIIELYNSKYSNDWKIKLKMNIL